MCLVWSGAHAPVAVVTMTTLVSLTPQVFCAACCSLKCRLMYMDRKEARVCVTCHSALMTGEYPVAMLICSTRGR